MRSLIAILLFAFVNPSWGQGAFPLNPKDNAADLPLDDDTPHIVEVLPEVSPNGPTAPKAKSAAIQAPAERAAGPPPTKPVPATSVAPEVAAEPITSHTVEKGGSLMKVSAAAFGRPGYWRVLKLYNEVDPNKLKVGQVIKAPDLMWLMGDAKLIPLYEDAVDDFMNGRRLYMAVEDRLEITQDKIILDDQAKQDLVSAGGLILNSMKKFGEKREGVAGLPNSLILQLRTVSELIGDIAKDATRTAAKMNLVHEHCSNAIVYGVIWARAGFK